MSPPCSQLCRGSFHRFSWKCVSPQDFGSLAMLYSSILVLAIAVAAKAKERVAVCIYGRIRAVHFTSESQQRNLFDPLCGGSCRNARNVVDVFMAGPIDSSAQLAAGGIIFKDFPWLVKGARFQDESYVLQYLKSKFSEPLHEALQVGGNWLGSNKQLVNPYRLERRSGSGIFVMFSYQQCLEMIEAREDWTSAKYDRIILSRADFFWTFPHPPLDILSATAAWIPDTLKDDWGGLYDRHIVFPRSAAKWVLGGWSFLKSGKALRMILDVLGEGARFANTTNTEVWLAVRLLAGQVPVSRFPATAYLACDAAEWRTPSGGTWAGEKSFHGSLNTKFKCQPEGFRYPDEFKAARDFADCFRSFGSGDFWSKAAVQKCYCPQVGVDLTSDEFGDLYQICHPR